MAIDPNRQLPAGLPASANLAFFDALIRHQIFLLRMAGSTRNDIVELLNATERDMAERIRVRLGSGRGFSPAQLARVDALMADIAAFRGAAHAEILTLLIKTMNDFVVKEAGFVKKAFETVVPVEIETTLPTQGTLRALVRERPFEGRTLRQWARNMATRDLQRIEQQIRIGIVQGEGGAAIARRVVGTARLKGRDGVTQLTRRTAEMITRTATIHYSNSAREEFLSANAEFFGPELYVATLDGVTTPICRSLDGREFPVGEGPMPPLHMLCRSLRVALITQDVIGTRPFKPTTERTLVREFTNGRLTSRAKLPHGTKGQFDQFARRRARELIGRVPAKVTYTEWLRTQSATFQDDVLGVTKGRLFRRGNLPLSKFVNRAGDEIPLSQLARTDASAFRAAGLDPGDFE